MAADDPTSLKGHILIAMPGLADPNFVQTVTCICEHTEQGAMGIVVNRLHDGLFAKDIFEELSIACSPDRQSPAVHAGGPVHAGDLFVLHGTPLEWEATLRVTPTLGLSNTRDILEAIACGRGPSGVSHQPRLRGVGTRSTRDRDQREHVVDAAGRCGHSLHVAGRRPLGGSIEANRGGPDAALGHTRPRIGAGVTPFRRLLSAWAFSSSGRPCPCGQTRRVSDCNTLCSSRGCKADIQGVSRTCAHVPFAIDGPPHSRDGRRPQ